MWIRPSSLPVQRASLLGSSVLGGGLRRQHAPTISAWPLLQLSSAPRRQSLSTKGFRESNRYNNTDESVHQNNQKKKTALVLGSSGALGSSVAHHLSQSLGMRVLGADVMELPNDLAAGGWELDGFIELQQRDENNNTGSCLAELCVELVRGVEFCLRDLRANQQDYDDDDDGEEATSLQGLDAIVCANGGWHGDPPVPSFNAGDDASSRYKLIEAGALDYANTISDMMHMNLHPVLAAGYVAQHFCNPTGSSIMVVMGATAALSPTPGMLGYGLAKAATHHLVQTLGASTGPSLESKSVRKAGRKTRQKLPALDELTVVGILPTMIDTEANRRADPNGSFDQWTKPHHIAREIGTWIEKPPLRPHSGSLIKVYQKAGAASFELVR